MCGVMNTDEVYGFLDLYEEIEALWATFEWFLIWILNSCMSCFRHACKIQQNHKGS